MYIYDATGKVFYAKGFYIDGGVYYSDVLSEDGPVISVTKVYNEASNVVDMVIGVMPVNEGGEVTVRVNNSMGLDEKDEYIYDYTATSNGTYIITAEEGEVTSIKRVKVSEITEGEYNIVYHYQDGTTPDETVKKKDMYMLDGQKQRQRRHRNMHLEHFLQKMQTQICMRYGKWEKLENSQ